MNAKSRASQGTVDFADLLVVHTDLAFQVSHVPNVDQSGVEALPILIQLRVSLRYFNRVGLTAASPRRRRRSAS